MGARVAAGGGASWVGAVQWEEQANKRLEGGAAGGGTKYR